MFSEHLNLDDFGMDKVFLTIHSDLNRYLSPLSESGKHKLHKMMKEAKTMEEAEKVNKDFVADISEFEKENKDAYDAIEKDKAKKEAVEAAGQGYTKVMMEKFFELNSAKQLAH